MKHATLSPLFGLAYSPLIPDACFVCACVVISPPELCECILTSLCARSGPQRIHNSDAAKKKHTLATACIRNADSSILTYSDFITAVEWDDGGPETPRSFYWFGLHCVATNSKLGK